MALIGAAWLPRAARAQADEAWLLELDASFVTPVSEPQVGWFLPGASAALTVHRTLSPMFSIGLRLRGAVFGDGPAPSQPQLADPGVGDLWALSLGFRVRAPLESSDRPERATGPFLELAAGAAVTGALVRPIVSVATGWLIAAEAVDIGPLVRLSSVFDIDAPVATGPALMLEVGLSIVLFDPRPHPAQQLREPGDRDHDGIEDSLDRCPDAPEHRDQHRDEDGCPDPDNDGDGVLDRADRCPDAPEDLDGVEDEDGCPEEEEEEPRDDLSSIEGANREVIEIVGSRIVLETRVLFDFQRARVRRRGRRVLRGVVALIRDNPHWASLRIEGHADIRGTDRYNQRLSELRARRVLEAMRALGVSSRSLEHLGYGRRRPRDHGRSERAHQRNRRVEFVITRRRRVRRAAGTETERDHDQAAR